MTYDPPKFRITDRLGYETMVRESQIISQVNWGTREDPEWYIEFRSAVDGKALYAKQQEVLLVEVWTWYDLRPDNGTFPINSFEVSGIGFTAWNDEEAETKALDTMKRHRIRYAQLIRAPRDFVKALELR